MGKGCQHHSPATLPTESLSIYCIGGLLKLRAGLEGCGKLRTRRDSIPGPSRQERVAIATELFPDYYSMGTVNKAAER